MIQQKFLLNTCHIIIDGLFESVPILLSFIVISFGVGEKATGIILSLAIMISTLGGLSTRFFSHYVNFLPTFSLIIFLCGIGFFTNTFSQNIYLTGFCFILALAGYSVFHNLAFTYLTINSNCLSLGKVMGNFTAIGDMGRIPFASLAAFIASTSAFGFLGWRMVCFIYGLGSLVLAGGIFVYSVHMKEYTNQETIPAPTHQKLLPSLSLLRNHQYTLALSANILDAVGSDQIFAFLPYLLLAKGLDPKIIASFALAFTLGCFLGKIICGRMVDRFGSKKVFVIAEIIMVFLLITLILQNQLFIIIAVSLFLGIVTKGTIPVIQTIITEPIHEKEQYDDVFAISTFARGTTNILTPLLFGFIAAIWGINFIYGIMTIGALLAIMPVCIMVNNQ